MILGIDLKNSGLPVLFANFVWLLKWGRQELLQNRLSILPTMVFQQY
jgi:hypothetical protein